MISALVFNSIIYILMGLISSLIICPFVISGLKKFKARQSIRKEGPEEHKVKEGTPTMGGIGILLPVFILTPIVSSFSIESIILTLTTFGFFAVGFTDDLLIVMKGKNDGLRPKLKLLLQIIISALFSFYLYSIGHSTLTTIPFTTISFDLGLLYFPLIIFLMTGFSNAINLTDGLDGLAAGTTAISLMPLVFMLGYVLSTASNPLSYAGFSLGLICIGTCLGFLWFNSYPASVFMGDTGSLALGGLFSSIAIVGNNELWLPFVGFVFVIETLSVMIQVAYFKRTKKRIFLMSPLHHHFEKKGWRETKVSFRFYLIGLIASLISLLGFLSTR